MKDTAILMFLSLHMAYDFRAMDETLLSFVYWGLAIMYTIVGIIEISRK